LTPAFPLNSSITTQTTPQWLWTTHDCKSYLYQIFHTLLHNPSHIAYEKASRFEGFGPNMFSTTYVGWKTLYGTWEGDGIYSMIFVARNQEGAMPRGVTYEHFEMARKRLDGVEEEGCDERKAYEDEREERGY
jgi:hypothetical protein